MKNIERIAILLAIVASMMCLSSYVLSGQKTTIEYVADIGMFIVTATLFLQVTKRMPKGIHKLAMIVGIVAGTVVIVAWTIILFS